MARDVEFYLVGGAVRNSLLGIKVKDRDFVVVGADENYMIQHGFIKVHSSFPVFLSPTTREEYALARSEIKVGQGYKGFRCVSHPNISLEEDLKRRDITINALAMNSRCEIIDVCNGLSDLRQGLIRHINTQAFQEDPLRILRVARFYALLCELGFRVHPSTMQLLNQMNNQNLLQEITGDRVLLEIKKVIDLPHLEKFFECLVCTNANKHVHLKEILQIWVKHKEVFTHLNQSLIHHAHMEKIAFLLHMIPTQNLGPVMNYLHLDKATQKLTHNLHNYKSTILNLKSRDQASIVHTCEALMRYAHLPRMVNILKGVSLASDSDNNIQLFNDLIQEIKSIDYKKELSKASNKKELLALKRHLMIQVIKNLLALN